MSETAAVYRLNTEGETMTEQAFIGAERVIPIAEPTRGYDLLRWDMSASSRVINGVQDVTVAITAVPCRVLASGTVDEANPTMAQHISLASVRDEQGQLTEFGKALLAAVRLGLGQKPTR